MRYELKPNAVVALGHGQKIVKADGPQVEYAEDFQDNVRDGVIKRDRKQEFDGPVQFRSLSGSAIEVTFPDPPEPEYGDPEAQPE